MKNIKNNDEVKMIFKNDKEAMNKLMSFIINKLLDNDDIFKEIISENKNSKEGGHSKEHGQ